MKEQKNGQMLSDATTAIIKTAGAMAQDPGEFALAIVSIAAAPVIAMAGSIMDQTKFKSPPQDLIVLSCLIFSQAICTVGNRGVPADKADTYLGAAIDFGVPKTFIRALDDFKTLSGKDITSMLNPSIQKLIEEVSVTNPSSFGEFGKFLPN